MESDWVTKEAINLHWHVLHSGEWLNDFTAFSHKHSS